MIALRPIQGKHAYKKLKVREGKEIPKDILKFMGGEEVLKKAGLAVDTLEEYKKAVKKRNVAFVKKVFNIKKPDIQEENSK